MPVIAVEVRALKPVKTDPSKEAPPSITTALPETGVMVKLPEV